MDIVTVLIGLAIAGLSVYGLVIGGQSIAQWRTLGADDPVPIRDAIATNGTVEIEGDVQAYEETLESPHFGQECVAYEYKTEERRTRRSGSRSGARSSWRTIDSGEAARSFLITDSSGTAYVDPDGADFSFERERTRKTNAQGDPIPDDSTFNLNISLNIPGMGSLGVNNRRYTEKRLDVGSHCYAVGHAERPPAGVDADVAIVGSDGATFLLSDATEAETRSRLLRRGAGFAIGGLLGAILGIGILGSELL